MRFQQLDREFPAGSSCWRTSVQEMLQKVLEMVRGSSQTTVSEGIFQGCGSDQSSLSLPGFLIGAIALEEMFAFGAWHVLEMCACVQESGVV